MKAIFSILVAICLLRLSAALWPLPDVARVNMGRIRLSRSFKISWQYADGLNLPPDDLRSILENRLDHVVDRTLLGLERILRLKHRKGWNFIPNLYNAQLVREEVLCLRVVMEGIDSSLTDQPVREEAYVLNLEGSTEGSTNSLYLHVQSSTAAIRGLITFLQLVEQTPDGILLIPSFILIADEPFFQHRGLNLDLSRHYISMEALERTVRGMEMNKMNRLHLHFTDSQSWPLHIPLHPHLSGRGTYRPGAIYTLEDIMNLQQYAFDRGIVIIPEIDTPSHTAVIAKAYPELVLTPEQSMWQHFCVQPPCGQLKLRNPGVHRLMNDIFSFLGANMNIFSSSFHTGGDEISENIYELQFGKNSRAEIESELQSFLTLQNDYLHSLGYKQIVWEDIILEWNCTLPKSRAIVQTWKSAESVSELLSMGYKVIAGISDYCFLDCGYGQWLAFEYPDPAAGLQYRDWCDPVKNWMHIYSYDPVKGLGESDARNVLGFEAHMWTEKTDDTNLDQKLWPRLSAAAEVMWTGPESIRPKLLPQASVRLSHMRYMLLEQEIQAEPIHMEWCDHNPFGCVFWSHTSNSSHGASDSEIEIYV